MPYEVVLVPNSVVEVYSCYPNLRCVQGVVKSPKGCSRCVAHTRCSVTRVAVCFSKDEIEALRFCGCYIRIEGGQIGSYRRLGHQILQQATLSKTERTTVVMLGNPRISRISVRVILRRLIDVRGD